VPKKLLVHAAHFSDDFADAEGFGWQGPAPVFSWNKLIEGKNREIARLSAMYESNLDRSGVTVLHGAAQLVDAHTVEVGGQRIRAEYLLVATGGRPFLPNIPGIEHAITSNEAFDLPGLPARILIVGGGYIAVEFAGIFNGLGARVTLSYRGEQILRGFDDDLRRHLHDEMRKHGIDIRLGSQVTALERRGDGALDARFSAANDGTPPFDAVMYATGRVPNVAGLGLADDVLPGEAERDGLALNREGLEDALLGERVDHVRLDAEITESQRGTAFQKIGLSVVGAYLAPGIKAIPRTVGWFTCWAGCVGDGSAPEVSPGPSDRRPWRPRASNSPNSPPMRKPTWVSSRI